MVLGRAKKCPIIICIPLTRCVTTAPRAPFLASSALTAMLTSRTACPSDAQVTNHEVDLEVIRDFGGSFGDNSFPSTHPPDGRTTDPAAL